MTTPASANETLDKQVRDAILERIARQHRILCLKYIAASKDLTAALSSVTGAYSALVRCLEDDSKRLHRTIFDVKMEPVGWRETDSSETPANIAMSLMMDSISALRSSSLTLADVRRFPMSPDVLLKAIAHLDETSRASLSVGATTLGDVIDLRKSIASLKRGQQVHSPASVAMLNTRVLNASAELRRLRKECGLSTAAADKLLEAAPKGAGPTRKVLPPHLASVAPPIVPDEAPISEAAPAVADPPVSEAAPAVADPPVAEVAPAVTDPPVSEAAPAVADPPVAEVAPAVAVE